MKKSSNKEPFLPLFFGDFLGATAEWDGEERALYLLALGYQWTLGSLPADTRKLRKLLDYQQDVFERYWPTVSIKFQQKEKRLINPRLEEHRAKTQSLSEKNSEAGKKGAQKRWQKRHEKRYPDDDDNSGGRHFSGEGEKMADAISSDGERHGKPLASAKPEDGDRHENANSERYGATDSNPSHPIPSHPKNYLDTSHSVDNSSGATAPPNTRKKREDSGSKSEEPPGFAEIRQYYPRRGGDQRWNDAAKHYRARLREGHTHEAIVAGVKRYAEHIRATGKERTEFVQQAATFLGTNRSFLEAWEVPRPPPEQRQLSAVEQVRMANGMNGAKRDERVVSEQRAGQGFGDVDVFGGDVRPEAHAGLRRIGS